MRSLKKFLLTAFVIVALGIYTLAYRRGGEATLPRPVSLNQSPSSTPISSPVAGSTPINSTPAPTSIYKDGVFTGSVADAFYGNIQVAVTISGGKITDVKFLQYPNDQPNSVSINTQAMPFLKQEAIQAQSAQVDGVTGATDTSMAFVQSLSSALSQAKL